MDSACKDKGSSELVSTAKLTCVRGNLKDGTFGFAVLNAQVLRNVRTVGTKYFPTFRPTIIFLHCLTLDVRVLSSETSVNVYHSTQRDVREDMNLQQHRCESVQHGRILTFKKITRQLFKNFFTFYWNKIYIIVSTKFSVCL
jgi:hypothetical protein